jgi:UTP:GlnB (protein PII) uridylyltransferase
VLTLGERAEDVFLISGAALGSAKGQLAIESDLLDALAAPHQSSASAISGNRISV